jgi:hypothetical protein
MIRYPWLSATNDRACLAPLSEVGSVMARTVILSTSQTLVTSSSSDIDISRFGCDELPPFFSAQGVLTFGVKKGELTEDRSSLQHRAFISPSKTISVQLRRTRNLRGCKELHCVNIYSDSSGIERRTFGDACSVKHTVHGPPRHSEIGNGSGNAAAVPYASMAQTKATPNNTALAASSSPHSPLALPISSRSRVATSAAGNGSCSSTHTCSTDP